MRQGFVSQGRQPPARVSPITGGTVARSHLQTFANTMCANCNLSFIHEGVHQRHVSTTRCEGALEILMGERAEREIPAPQRMGLLTHPVDCVHKARNNEANGQPVPLPNVAPDL